jgi:hypothetical protein
MRPEPSGCGRSDGACEAARICWPSGPSSSELGRAQRTTVRGQLAHTPGARSGDCCSAVSDPALHERDAKFPTAALATFAFRGRDWAALDRGARELIDFVRPAISIRSARSGPARPAPGLAVSSTAGNRGRRTGNPVFRARSAATSPPDRASGRSRQVGRSAGGCVGCAQSFGEEDDRRAVDRACRRTRRAAARP